MVATDNRDVSQGPVADYVFVDWGDVYLTEHAEAFPLERDAGLVDPGKNYWT